MQLEKDIDDKVLEEVEMDDFYCRRQSRQFHIFGFFTVHDKVVKSKSNSQVSLRNALGISYPNYLADAVQTHFSVSGVFGGFVRGERSLK